MEMKLTGVISNRKGEAGVMIGGLLVFVTVVFFFLGRRLGGHPSTHQPYHHCPLPFAVLPPALAILHVPGSGPWE